MIKALSSAGGSAKPYVPQILDTINIDPTLIPVVQDAVTNILGLKAK